ncbi:DUF1613 domain-containing protein [Auriscalpium vulgare]|uniref:DUF1613 domain-containing protein n=1 Tax=Auriscalpium vulgare TaxID=40419 RepID=A0ACB8S6T6_9AGAM|nr:DUF1613 domain-containing protein [Auriscalpium vulgare]
MTEPPIERPRFTPTPCQSQALLIPPLESAGQPWTPILSCPADFPPELFELAISQLIHHPEYNSTLILRSEVVDNTTEHFPPLVPALKDLWPVRNIHRKLLPRRPTRDAGLEQHCTLFSPSPLESHAPVPTTLVLTPILAPDVPLPYYHPTVSSLAFRYLPSTPPALRIEVVPLPGTDLDPNARLHRTCLALLETLHRYGWGARTQYRKRVAHDCLVPREPYQDLYLVMRERHKHLVDEWKEVTDPLKHVFEDIGIATYLMLLWKYTFAEESAQAAQVDIQTFDAEPWRAWPRPPGGFADIGCGNGLLTHILTAEGYDGHGFDVRARTSWSHYPPSTQASLHVSALDPTSPPPTTPSPAERYPFLPPGCFIIGNHADELTPWVPVLATLSGASGYLSIPCCAWTFDARYERSRDTPYAVPLPAPLFTASLNLGGEGANTSAYSMYRIWLASLSVHCGWEVECETLRIPSTRNWALIGRRKGEDSLSNAEEIVDGVRRRGAFKTRRPEGKAGEH